MCPTQRHCACPVRTLSLPQTDCSTQTLSLFHTDNVSVPQRQNPGRPRMVLATQNSCLEKRSWTIHPSSGGFFELRINLEGRKIQISTFLFMICGWTLAKLVKNPVLLPFFHEKSGIFLENSRAVTTGGPHGAPWGPMGAHGAHEAPMGLARVLHC